MAQGEGGVGPCWGYKDRAHLVEAPCPYSAVCWVDWIAEMGGVP